MLVCKDVTKLVSSGKVENLGWWGRLEYRMHLMMCKHCRNYVKQIKAIGRVTGQVWGRLGGDPSHIAALEDRILQMLD